MGIESWSTTAASNNSAPPNGWPEGQAASTVNDCARQMMASIRSWFEDAQWVNLGHTPTRIDNDTFTVATDLTAIYHAGRRLKLTGGSTGYASISSVSYSAPNTTINVTMDSGNLPNPLTSVYVSILSASNSAVAQSSVTQYQSALTIARSQLAGGTGALVYSHVNLSISNSTNTMLAFDSEVYDDASIHSTSSNTSRLTVPSGVNRVVIKSGVSHLGSTTTNSSFRMTLYKNGSIYTPQVHSMTFGAATNSVTYRQELVSPPIPVVAGDYFEIEVWQNTGSSMTLALDTIWASMEFVQ